MSQTIAIVNYGMGNVRSVQKALEHVAPNDRVILTDDAKIIDSADRIVFPGQGAMGACMQALNEHNLVDIIKRCEHEKPFLGICLGLQLLFDHSEENGGTKGLSIVSGDVVRFPKNDLKIPHMGWNSVKQTQDHPLWHNIKDNSRFYSVHSYYVKEADMLLLLDQPITVLTLLVRLQRTIYSLCSFILKNHNTMDCNYWKTSLTGMPNLIIVARSA